MTREEQNQLWEERMTAFLASGQSRASKKSVREELIYVFRVLRGLTT
ncbi:hypothetical protein [Ammoniphilus sp. CFH 90114]|nr:hypothetical protein [Ammoniphilus sp. CFH 90114]